MSLHRVLSLIIEDEEGGGIESKMSLTNKGPYSVKTFTLVNIRRAVISWDVLTFLNVCGVTEFQAN
jgi:hypothetical protein